MGARSGKQRERPSASTCPRHPAGSVTRDWPSCGPAQRAGWPFRESGDARLETTLRDRLGGLASVTDQSDGRVVLRFSGPSVRDLLGKALAVDLHPRTFRPGDVALTQAFHIATQVWQVDEAPTYDLFVARSVAGSLAAWMVEAAEEYGVVVVVGA